jgi:hypothetical protein
MVDVYDDVSASCIHTSQTLVRIEYNRDIRKK